jgi:hypothetical protein
MFTMTTATTAQIAAALPGSWTVQTDTHGREYLQRADGIALRYSTGNGRKGEGSLSFHAPADPCGSVWLDWTRQIPYDRREAAQAAVRCNFTATRSPEAIAGHWVRSCLEATEEAYAAALACIEQFRANAAAQKAAADALAAAGYEIRTATYSGDRPILYGADTLAAWAKSGDDAPSWTIEAHGSIRIYRDLYPTLEQALAIAAVMRKP